MKRFFSVSCVFDRNHPSVWRRVWFSLKLNSNSNQRMERMKQKTPAVTIPLLRSRVCASAPLQSTPAITAYVLLMHHALRFLFLITNLFCSPALKNSADRKFSYLQLPVSLKLLYTVLQVHVSLGSVRLVRWSCLSQSAVTCVVGDE